MLHEPKIVDIQELAGGLLAVRARCCDDETTDSVLTLGELHRTEAEIDANIAAHLAKIATLHQATEHAKAHIERLMK